MIESLNALMWTCTCVCLFIYMYVYYLYVCVWYVDVYFSEAYHITCHQHLHDMMCISMKHITLHVTGVIMTCWCVFGVRSGQGKLEKSGKHRNCFPATRKSGNIDYSPIVRESQGNWKFLGKKINKIQHTVDYYKATEIMIEEHWL